MPHLEENADIFIKSLEEYADTDREVHMLPEFEQLSMDYTARGAFGVDEHFQEQPDHPLFNTARAVLRGVMKGPLPRELQFAQAPQRMHDARCSLLAQHLT